MGITERKERERLQRQNLIIDAAGKVFMAKGFENATMDDVAETAGFSKGSLYTYFQSKNELCLFIVLRGLKVVVSKLKKVVTEKTLSINKIDLLASTFLKFHNDYPNYIFAFSSYRQHRAACKLESTVLEDIDTQNMLIREMIIKIVQAGKRDKSIRPDADEEKLSYIIWGDLLGLFPNLLLENGNTNSIELYNYTIMLVREAIKVRNETAYKEYK